MQRPTLYIFSGLPGTGKSTISQLLAAHLGAAYVRIDTIEQALRAMCALDVQGEGYGIAYRLAADNLGLGISVVASDAPCINIEVICSDAKEHQRRVESRLCTIPGLSLPTWQQVVERGYYEWTASRLVLDTFGRGESESLAELLAKMPQKVGALDRSPEAIPS